MFVDTAPRNADSAHAHVLYCCLPGLLARAAAQARQIDEALLPLAVAEGKAVADVSPLAQAHGVHQGLSLLRARRICPLLLAVPVDQVDARTLSHRLYDALADLSPTVEPAGADAAFLTLYAYEVALVEGRVGGAFPGLIPTLGTGKSKLVARTCSQTGGAFDQAPSRFLWPQDEAVAGKLERLGLLTVGQVECIGLEALRYQLGGKIGSLLHRRSQGIDSDPVKPLWPPMAIAIDRRFDLEPLTDSVCLDFHLVALARQAAAELADLRRYGRVVTLAVQTERATSSREWRPPWPLQSPAEVISAARRLLALQPPTAPVLSLTLSVAELDLPGAQSLSLFDAVGAQSRRRLDAARRLVVARYGAQSLTTLGKVPISLRDRRRQLAHEARLR